ncbi:MAG TPA: hypothetical protein ENK23_05775 [Sorangium sp.]|nr:hypothetical protein [Sorangium sp.]
MRTWRRARRGGAPAASKLTAPLANSRCALAAVTSPTPAGSAVTPAGNAVALPCPAGKAVVVPCPTGKAASRALTAPRSDDRVGGASPLRAGVGGSQAADVSSAVSSHNSGCGRLHRPAASCSPQRLTRRRAVDDMVRLGTPFVRALHGRGGRLPRSPPPQLC